MGTGMAQASRSATVANDVCKAGTTGTGGGQFATNNVSATGFAVHLIIDDVYVADVSNRRVQRFNLDGSLDTTSVVGSSANFATNYPVHLAVDVVRRHRER